ncbi:MAG TPA: hypothetical protein DEH65_13070 [Delftia acidovorans]|nr:hypothetical protein [Delftia sp.]HBY35888.1 hypothetical protein [Delftia acidovorans]
MSAFLLSITVSSWFALLESIQKRPDCSWQPGPHTSSEQKSPHATLAAQGPLPPRGAAFCLGAARRQKTPPSPLHFAEGTRAWPAGVEGMDRPCACCWLQTWPYSLAVVM